MRAAPVVCAAALVLLNLYVCRDIFFIDTGAMNSMQGFWAAIARTGPPAPWEAAWWPWWDAGMPAEFTYAPLFPALARAWAWLGGMTHTLGVRCVIGAIYCLGPATLFLMAWRFTRRLIPSFAAGLLYSLFSLGQPLAPDSAARFGSIWNPQRFYLAAVWDEAPHLLALALLPVALVLLAAAIQRRSSSLSAAAAAAFGAMALASAFGPAMSALAAIALAVAMRGGGMRAAAVGAGAYAIASPYLTPAVLKAMAAASAFGPEGSWNSRSLAVAALTILAVALVERASRGAGWPLRFFGIFTALAAAPPLFETYLHWHVLPQPNRYKLEMEFGLALLVPFAIPGRWIRVAAVLLLVALSARQVVGHRRFAKATLRTPPVTGTVEYRAANWIAANLSGTRVFLPGSIAQWANAFADVHQFSGGSWSTAFNPAIQHGVTGVVSGEPLPWLKAFGAGAIAVSSKDSQEFWKPYLDPAKFEGLPVLWRDSGVTIYRVPRGRDSLAHLVPESDLVARAPASHADTAEIERYAAALDLAPQGTVFEWMARDRIRIRIGAPQPNLALSIQVSHDRRWRAMVDGAPRALRGDGLGLMVLQPGCARACEVELVYR